MALRMAVNDEPGQLDRLLEALPDLVASQGRAVIISFMSHDARKVKERFRGLARDGRAVLLTKHAVKPTDDEVARNAPSRSATLRAIQMT